MKTIGLWGLLLVLVACQSQAAETRTLVFNPSQYGLQNVESVVLRGSFTSWKKSAWPLQKGSDGLWRITRAEQDFNIPGNSGQPEYKFVVNNTQWIGADAEQAGYQFTGNFVVLFPGDDPLVIAANNEKAQRVRDQYETEEQLSNFRELKGGKLGSGLLYRSYHPFIPSRSELKAEADRLKSVQRLMEENGVQAVINLSDTSEDLRSPLVPPYYAGLVAQGKVLLEVTSYEDSYYAPAAATYGQTLQGIFAFMATHPGPYLLHCRLGTDRTGVVSAILQAFMGVPWETIAADFDRSNDLGIREYRHPKLLAYALKQMIGTAPQDTPDLAAAIRVFLLRQGIRNETMEAVRNNLQPRTPESF